LSDRTYKPILGLMDDIGIYREGGLPPFSRRFFNIDLKILRCSYWKVFYWQHDTLMAPYWRIYWNNHCGAVIYLNGTQFPIEPDSLYMIPPNTSFSTSLDLNPSRKDKNFLMGCPVNREEQTPGEMKSLNHFFIHFSAGLPCDRISEVIYKIPLSPESSKIIGVLTDKLSYPSSELDMHSVFSMRALINLLLMNIPDDHWPEEIVDNRIRGVIEFIEKNYVQQILMGELADMVNMSENGFSRLFKKNTGKSPKDYLIDRRLDHACNLLHHSSYSIDEIAGLCGFCDRSYFSRMFIKKFSSGPAKFRKTAFISQ
jgi:AraC-like DNA-binding protein